ncbi:spliceosome-associated protein CWC27 homolog [Ostrinia furnacalis]|uniref:spliceosome-associated protein CWC27 homolog n=1 Tax=Ostrinia furnacalis TaxID=93504 RepID=UPI001040B8E8|nr:spliceosome-associated protein CWC27 homolog [Ostrinia furnacalis]
MSNIYIQEPPALGKVLLKTTAGEIDVELWTKEAPKACRNFIQLCMEGYYNGTIFHRVVPGFIVQGGDPNGDGTGGESIYGAPFKDEFHSRLRFNRRGLVAMANAGKDDNGSQFFFTLAATPELQNKHTIFGKVTGETIYNMLKLSEGLIDHDDRPEHPQKILSTTVVINPFTDIEPRVTEKRVDEAPKKKKKERQGVKNFGLLSFGEEAEEDEGEAVEYRGKPKSTHDLLDDPKLSKKTAAELELELEEQVDQQSTSAEDIEKKEKTAAAVSSIRDKLNAKKRDRTPDKESNKKRKEETKEDSESEGDGEYYLGKERDMERQKERDRIRNEIKQLKKEMRAPKEDSKKESETEDSDKKKIEEDNEMYKKYVEEQEKYKKMKEKIPKKGADRRRRYKFTKTPKRKPWVKNLYENREYPDNYTDSKFLEDLRKNLFVQKVTLSEAFYGSFRIVFRMCLCVLYAVLFVYMYNDYVNTNTVIYAGITVTVFCYLLYVVFEGSDQLRHVRTVLVYLVLGYLLSPIVHTLTDTVSTDTIYAWAVIMMLVHLIFFDYEVKVALVSKSLSINAAIFASVCLVSRLATPFDAFILLTVSVIFFVLSPQLFKVLLYTRLFTFIYFITLLITLASLYTVSVTLLCYFVILVGIVNVYCPVMFVRWQKYKANIYGPWDEAVINDSDDLDECLQNI